MLSGAKNTALARSARLLRPAACRLATARPSLVAQRELSRTAPAAQLVRPFRMSGRYFADTASDKKDEDTKNTKADESKAEDNAKAEGDAKAEGAKAAEGAKSEEGAKASERGDEKASGEGTRDATEGAKADEKAAEPEPEPLSPGMALKLEVEQLQQDVKATKHKYLLALADFENNKKRLKKERDSRNRYATTNFSKKMVGVYKKFDGAFPDSKITAADDDQALHALEEGIVLVRKAFNSTLGRFDVQRAPFEVGAPFVASRHEKAGTIEGDGTHKPDSLGEQLEPCWVLTLRGQPDMVLEKARVNVFSSGPPTPPTPPK